MQVNASRQETVLGYNHPRLTLNRLHYHARRLLRYPGQILHHVEAQMIHIRQQRSEHTLTLRIRHKTQRSMGRPVITVYERSHAPTARKPLGQFQGRIHSLGTGIDIVDAVQRRRQNGCEQRCVQHLRGLYHLPVDHQVKIILSLCAHGGRHIRMMMTYVADTHTGYHIQIPAVSGIDKNTIRPVYLNSQRGW